jgi:hypothetical protein
MFPFAPRIRAGAILLLALGFVPGLRAGLTWEHPRIAVSANPGEKTVHVVFPFRNTGTAPVRLVSLETSCRCLSATGPGDACRPGGKGDVAVDFSVGNQRGLVEKTVTIETDEKDAGPITLFLDVTIPDPRP